MKERKYKVWDCEQIWTCEQQSGFSVSVYDGVMVKFVFLLAKQRGGGDRKSVV